MKADTGRLDGRLESALLEHGNQPDQIACRVKGLAMILTWIRALGHAVAGAAAPPRSLRISPPACAETPGFPPHRRPAPHSPMAYVHGARRPADRDRRS